MRAGTGIRYAVQRPALRWVLSSIDRLLGRMIARRVVPIPTQPSRILVCMQAHLGDAILATAVIPPLMQAFPGAQLGFLVHPAAEQLVRAHTGLAGVHRVEHWRLNRSVTSFLRKWMHHWHSGRAAVRAIRRCNYDVGIDLYHHFPNSAPLMFRAGIPVRVGWSSAGFSPLLTHVIHDAGLPVNILDRHALVLAALNIPTDPSRLRPDIEVSVAARARWQSISEPAMLPAGFIALHVGAHAAYKRWPDTNWSTLVERLSGNGHAVALFGQGEEDAALCRRMKSGARGVHDFSNRLQLDELCAAMADCSLLVSHDSAAAHLAAAFDKPRVCLNTGINEPGTWLRQTVRSEVMTKTVPCAPCFRSAGCASMDCIRGIEVDDVLRAVDRMLVKANPSGRAADSPAP